MRRWSSLVALIGWCLGVLPRTVKCGSCGLAWEVLVLMMGAHEEFSVGLRMHVGAWGLRMHEGGGGGSMRGLAAGMLGG